MRRVTHLVGDNHNRKNIMKPSDLGLWKRYRGEDNKERTIAEFRKDGRLVFQDHTMPRLRFLSTPKEFAHWAKEEV